MVEFSNTKDIQRWLEDKPHEVAITVAARSALRMIPALAWELWPKDANAHVIARAEILPVLRATAAPWVAARYPTRRSEIQHAADAAAAAAAAATTVNTKASLQVSLLRMFNKLIVDRPPEAYQAGSRVSASIFAARAAACSADATNEVIVNALRATAIAPGPASSDASAIDEGILPANVAGLPIWYDGQPEWVRDDWTKLKRILLSLNGDWSVWTDWYDARLEGRLANEELEVARVIIAEEVWRQGPKTVNAEIKRLSRTHGHTVEQAIEAMGRWDFFLSYSSEDEASARWIAALLRAAGYSVFAQFGDIKAGSNFVREMQRGLERSIRLIALQSPAYLKSDHCQAEWSEAYSRDPGGRARRLIQFLVAPTDLPPLARQIVYTSLVGLSPADARAAVLRSFEHHGPIPEIPLGWPGSAAIESIQAASGGIYNVAPGATGLLERQPSAINREGEGGFTPEQLFADLAREISEFAKHTKKKKGNFSYSDRLRDRAHRLNLTTKCEFSHCDPLALHKQLVWALRVVSLDFKEGLIPPNDEIEMYARDLFGYYNRLAHIFPQLKVYREMEARQRFTSPEPAVQEAIDIIYGSFGDPGIAADALSPRLSEELKEAGEDIARAKKLEEAKPFDDTRDVTVESHTNAATRSLAVWNWLANAPDKFAKSGKNVEDFNKAIENYEKLYGKLAPQMQTYLGYLLKWFF